MVDWPVAFAAPRLVIACKRGYSFQQRGFPGAILADDDCDGAIEAELETLAQKRQAERIGVRIGDLYRIKPQALQKWGRKPGVAISSHEGGGVVACGL